MRELTYKSIKPYVLEEIQEGNKLCCKFVIEEKEFESETIIEQISNQKNLRRIVQNPSRMRSMLLQVLKKRSSKTSEETDENNFSFSKIDIEAAVIRAFEQIMGDIVYIETTNKWHLATQFSAFEVYIRQNPLTEFYDKKIMSRMLVEMARADGRIEKEERLFFEHFMNDETGRLSDLMRAPFLTTSDCSKVSKNGRPTIFIIVAAVALTDNSFDEDEKMKLNKFAQLFGFDDKQQQELFQIAQEYTMEIAIKVLNRKMKTTELSTFASKIGLSEAVAKEVQARLELV